MTAPDLMDRVAPGAHILVRDEAWRVLRVDPTSTGGKAIHAVGLSPLVRDKESIFLTEYEPPFRLLAPEETDLIRDPSSNYQASLLVLESLLRRVPPTDDRLHVGHRAAMDVLPFQLQPAQQALRQARPRILIADAVGLGKTLEAGILLSELIARGRGKRILVVTLKSLLTQFQKEMWSRFTIPLVRLDSVGLQRIRQDIPTNHNPFYHFDRCIISIDTLKQNNEYRHFLEQAAWDVIVIDEAHNVALRGNNQSLRARLAELLASRSDALILLSATPHDGRARSFASLMNMLDPTAIANPEDYKPGEISGLYIRRFRKDVVAQLGQHFPERRIDTALATATPTEEVAFQRFADLRFSSIDRRNTGQWLFKISLEKGLLSSPQACLQSIGARMRKLQNQADPDTADPQSLADLAADLQALQDLAADLQAIGPAQFAKYQKLLQVIRDQFQWKPRSDDRLVIFTERIETLRFLEQQLAIDLGLKKDQIATLYGEGTSDVQQQQVVEDFGKDKSPLRLLIASDIASEGINLHYLCHKMIHFDIPWSLLVFQQRNGRIDRYGQKHQPWIVYLLTESRNPRLQGDARVLQLLIAKEQEARKNIGDVGALMKAYDIDEEERITALAIQSGDLPAFEAKLDVADFDPFEAALELAAQPDPQPPTVSDDRLSLFADDFDYLHAALEFLQAEHPGRLEADPARQRIELELPASLRRRFKKLPAELEFPDGRLILTADRPRILSAIEAARKEENAWPHVHYLGPLHPIFDWAGDHLAGHFGRHAAPVVVLDQGLQPTEQVFVLSGLLPNRKSQPLVHRWFGVVFEGGRLLRVEPFPTTVQRLQLGRRKLPNRQEAVDLESLRLKLPEAVAAARRAMTDLRLAFEADMQPRLQDQLQRLAQLRDRKLAVQQALFDADDAARQTQEVNRVFDEYRRWIADSRTTEEHPFLAVLAVLIAAEANP